MPNKHSKSRKLTELDLPFDQYLKKHPVAELEDLDSCMEMLNFICVPDDKVYHADWIEELKCDFYYSKTEYFIHKLKCMPYKDFLRTPYWKIIAATLKETRAHNTCHKCGKEHPNIPMHVHHITYKHHGAEIDYLEDLVVLCEYCHKDIHGIAWEYPEPSWEDVNTPVVCTGEGWAVETTGGGLY